MNILYFIILGGVAGWLASLFMGGGGSLLYYVIAGCGGAFLGGWLFGGMLLHLGLLGDLIIAFLGAVILIFILRLIMGNRGGGGS